MQQAGVNTGTYDEFKTSLGNKEDADWYYKKSREIGLDVGTADDFTSMMVDTASPSPSPTPTPASQIPRNEWGLPVTSAREDPSMVYRQAGDNAVAMYNEPVDKPLGTKKFAMQFEMNGTPRQMGERAGATVDALGKRAENMRKGNTSFGSRSSSEKRFNPQTGKMEDVYYTVGGNEVATPLRQFEENLREGGVQVRDPETGEINPMSEHWSGMSELRYRQQMQNVFDAVDGGDGNAAVKTWQDMEGNIEEARQRYYEDVERASRVPSGDPMVSFNAASMARGFELSVETLRAKDAEKLMNDAWKNLGREKQQKLIYGIIGQWTDGAADDSHLAALYPQAEQAARRMSDQRMTDYIVKQNIPDDTKEYLLGKAAEANNLYKLYQGMTRKAAGTTGDLAAKEQGLAEYEQEHDNFGRKIAGGLGTVLGFTVDPTLVVSGVVGKGVAGGATWLGGKIAPLASGRFATTMGGRAVAGAIGGAGNFAAFESIGEAANQFRHGGYINPETGETEGYSADAIGKAGLHGLGIGAATGGFGAFLGNVTGDLVRGTESVAGKAGIRLAGATIGTIGEGTIFSVPDMLQGKFDTWDDNMAMIIGFRIHGSVKSAPQMIRTLAGSPDSRLTIEERITSVLNGRPDLALTKDETQELGRAGYGDLTSYVWALKNRKEVGAAGDTFNAQRRNPLGASVDLWGDGAPIYERFSRLIGDANVSEAARAKMYHYLTGDMLPMSTVMGSKFTENKDDTGNVTGYTVQSFGANGVITSREFTGKGKAEYERALIDRQAELNSLALGERVYDNRGDEGRMHIACKNVGDRMHVSENMLYDLMKRDPKSVSEEEREVQEVVLKNYNDLGNIGSSEALREDVGERHGVDIDAVIRKRPKERSEEENAALTEYANMLFPNGERVPEDAAANTELRNITDGSMHVAPAEPANSPDGGVGTDETARREQEAFDEGYNADAQGRRDIAIENTMNPDEPLGKKKWEGIERRIEEEADYNIAMRRERDAKMQDKNGSIVMVKLNESSEDGSPKSACIVDGTVVMMEDGKTVDKERSDGIVVIYDPDTGERRQIDPAGILGVSFMYPPSTKDDIEHGYVYFKEQYIKNETEAARGKVIMQPGDSYPLPEGGEAIVLEATDKQVTLQMPDGGQQTMALADIQDAADAAALADYKYRHGMDTAVEDGSAEDSLPATDVPDATVLPDGMVGGAPETYEPGMEISVLDEDGKSMPAIVTSRGYIVFDGEGRSEFKPDETGNVIEYATSEDVYHDRVDMLDDKLAGYIPQQTTPSSTTSAAVADTAESDTAVAAAADVSISEADDIPTTLSNIHMKRGGMESDYISAKIARAKERVKHAAKKKNGVDDPDSDEWVSRQNEINNEQMEARQQLDYWTAVQNALADEAAAAEESVKAEAIRKADEAAEVRRREEEAARIERERQSGGPDVVNDKPKDARARGFRNVNGNKVERQQHTEGVVGRESSVKFSGTDTESGHIKVIEADQLQPSHVNGQRNPQFFIDEAQPKDRTDKVSSMAAAKIASSLNPEEITGDGSAYQFSAPTVNTRGEVIQGNNRSDALKLMWGNGAFAPMQDAYRQYMIDRADYFGIDADAVKGMKAPVMVNELDVSDEDAIRLGQMDARDNETGGVQRIDPMATNNKLGSRINSLANILLSSDDDIASISELISMNGGRAIEWLSRNGVISDTQVQSAFDKKGYLTPEARIDLQNVLKQSLFQGGVSDLPRMFDSMPSKAQRAILATFMRDFDSTGENRILPEIQHSVEAWYAASHASEEFSKASNYENAVRSIQGYASQYQFINEKNLLPSEIFSNFALELAARLQGCKQSEVQLMFNDFYDLVQGKGSGDLFGGKTGEQADVSESVRRVFGVEFKSSKEDSNNNGQERNDNVAAGAETGEGGQRAEQGDNRGTEQAESGARSSVVGGGTEAGAGQEVISDDLSGDSGLSEDAYDDSNPRSLSQRQRDPDNHPDPNPTEAQKKAGNYKLGHVRVDGYDISVEHEKGGVRQGTDAGGKEWKTTMHNDYGYFGKVKSVDGEHIDVFLSDNPTSDGTNVFVVDQVDPETGKFDEHKVMYGFTGMDDAKVAYLSNYEKGWNGLGAITEVSKEDFRKWMESSNRKTKPFSEYAFLRNNSDDAEKRSANVEEVAEDGSLTPRTSGYTIEKRKDTRDNSDIFAVKFEERVSKDEFKGQKEIAKKFGGYWSNFGKKGFLFKSEEAAQDFAETVMGRSVEEVEDEAPITINELAEANGGEVAPTKVEEPIEDATDDIRRAMQEDRDMMRKAVEQLGAKFGTPIHIYNDVEEITHPDAGGAAGRQAEPEGQIKPTEERSGEKRSRELTHNENEANRKFNEGLANLTEENADSIVLSCGRPSYVLKSVGIPDRELVLYGNKLIKKAKQHGYNVDDVTDLPIAINSPIAIFSGQYSDSYAILTEMELNGEKGLVSIDVNKGEIQDVNLITSVYGKDAHSMELWKDEGKMLYADKERVPDYLSISAPIAEARDNQEPISGAKVQRNSDMTYKKGEKFFGKSRKVHNDSNMHKTNDGVSADSEGENEGVFPKPPIDSERFYDVMQALRDAYASGDAASIQEASNGVRAYVDEGYDSPEDYWEAEYGQHAGAYFDEVEDYSGDDPARLADQYLVRVFHDRYIDDDGDHGYIRTGIKKSYGEGAAVRALTHEELSIIERAKVDGTYMKAPSGAPTRLTEKQWAQVRTKAFKAWFGDWEKAAKSHVPENNSSKVVDENGEPLVVYHGTNNGKFYSFDNSKGEKRSAIRYERLYFFSSSANTADTYRMGYSDKPETGEEYGASTQTIGEFNTFDRSKVLKSDWGKGVDYLVQKYPKKEYGIADPHGQWRYFDTREDAGKALEEYSHQKYSEDQVRMAVFLNLRNPYVYDAKGAFYKEAISGLSKEYPDLAWTDYDINGNLVGRLEENLGGHDGGIIRNVDDNGGLYKSEVSDVYIASRPDQIKSATENAGTYDGNDTRYRKSDDSRALHAPDDGLDTSPDAKRQKVIAIGEKFHTPIRIYDSVEEIHHVSESIQQRRRMAKGWYDTRSGEVAVVLPNNKNVDDAVATVLHEVVGHKGLRELVGEDKYTAFLRDVYEHADDAVRRRITAIALSYGWDYDKATDEYIAELSEKHYEDYSGAEHTLWQRIRAKIREVIDKLLGGIRLPSWVRLGDNELRYMLWKSAKHLEGNNRGPLEVAEDVTKRGELGLNGTGSEDTSVYMGSRVNKRMSEIRDMLAGRELSAEQRSVADVFGGVKDNETVAIKRGKESVSIVMRQGNENHAGTKHSIFRHYNTNVGWFAADDILLIPEIIEKGSVSISKVGKNIANVYEYQTSNGVKYKIVTEINGNREFFDDFYTNRNAPNPIASNTSKEAHSLESDASSEGKDTKNSDNGGKNLATDGNDPALYSDKSDDIWRDGSVGMEERIVAASAKLAADHTSDDKMRDNAMRAISKNIGELRKVMSLQKQYDRTTVKRVTDLARVLIQYGYLDGMTGGDIKRLLSTVKNSVGVKDIRDTVNNIMDIMVDNQLRNSEAHLHRLETLSGGKVDAKGVEVMGVLDPDGQSIVKTFKKSRMMQLEDIEHEIADAQDRIGSTDKSVSDNASLEYTGLVLARDYIESIGQSKQEEKELRAELKDLHDNAGEDDRLTESYRERRDTLEEAIRMNRSERIDVYSELISRLCGTMNESIQNADAFRRAEKRRIEEIHHNANSDMEGLPSDEHYIPDWKDKLLNNDVVQFFLQPLATFDQILRLIGSRSVNGEGYLYNRFMRGYVDARQHELTGISEKFAVLDKKVKELFVDSGIKSWGDLIRYSGKLPKMSVSFWNGGMMKSTELTQGNLMYLYMVDKMLDGRMKLRRMGVSEDVISKIRANLDPRIVRLADWLQDEFLVATRNEYNETHKRIFGASMAAVEHYFPLKILANARVDKPDELDNPGMSDGISTSTGSIIKRRRNTLALDVTGSDALNVILDHIAEMEHWNAFSEFNRDLNTLRTYKRFRNQMQNMDTVYGSGKELWKKFNDVCRLASGTYRPPQAAFDRAAVNLAKGVTAAKVSFRLFTALKQFLSMPAFLTDARPDYLIASIVRPMNAWTWSMEHLPIFRNRWSSRTSGDPRLLKSEMDWKGWRSNVVQVASRVGMSPNAFVDALTVSIGAYAVYRTRLEGYRKDGYSEDAADRKAIQDAEISYNQTQQSSEGAFLSAMQVDRSWLSVLLTVFRSASMSYSRKLLEHMRNVGRRMLRKGYRSESIEFMTKQYERDGLSRGQAELNAVRKYRKQTLKDVAGIATFGYIMQLTWNLVVYLPYVIFGDDDVKKNKLWSDVFTHTMFGSIEGLTGGDVLSQLGNLLASGDGRAEYLKKDMPITGDLYNLYRKLDGGESAEAFSDMINLVVQIGVGVNPQSITDAVVATMDVCGDDPALSREALIYVLRVLQVPQRQIEDIYLDEIGMSGGDVSRYTPVQLAERYARYKVKRGRFFTPWMWNDDEVVDKKVSYGKSLIKDRVKGLSDTEVNESYSKYEEQYKEFAKKVSDAKKALNEDYVSGAEKWSDLHNDERFGEYVYFKELDKTLDKLVDLYMNSESAESSRLCMDAIIEYKCDMVNVLRSDDSERQEKIDAMQEHLKSFYNEYQGI